MATDAESTTSASSWPNRPLTGVLEDPAPTARHEDETMDFQQSLRDRITDELMSTAVFLLAIIATMKERR